MKYALLFAASALGIATLANGQNRIGTGDVSQTYATYCASCHGTNLEGGQGSSLVDGVWKYGGSDNEIAASIRNGYPDMGMIGWKDTLSEDEIRSLVIFIREKRQQALSEQLAAKTGPSNGVFRSERHAFTLEKVGEGTGIVWGMDFMPDGGIIATQRDGELWIFRDGQRLGPIEATPKVWQHGQGGLMEVQLHPDYEKNGWIYLGYSERGGRTDGGRDEGMTAIVRGRIKDGRWVDQQSIFHVPEEFHRSAGVHFGTRFVFQDGYLFFSIGDRGAQDQAQDLALPNGKVHRIWDNGEIPQDNPFVHIPGAYQSIWSYGHRNPQGLDAHPVTRELWSTEHGPRGGDETNLVKKGLNYGWPVITYGMNYNGKPITHKTAQEGLVQPKHYWVPSIAVCGIDFYEGDAFPYWKGDLFVAGLASEELHRLVIEGGKVVHDEIVMKGQGRIRDVASGPDGLLYVALVEASTRVGGIYRLAPAASSSDS